MARFLKNIFFFFIFSFIVYVVLVIVWGEFMPERFKKNLNYPLGYYGHLFSRIKEIDQYKNVDILFLGASHAYRGLDTRIFKEQGYNSFNLGSSGQSPVQTEILIDRYLSKLNPKTIVYEVTPSTFTSDGVESSLDLIANDHIDYDDLKMAFELNDIKTYNTLIYGFYRQLLNKNKGFVENPVKADDTYVPGGFVEKKIAYNKDFRVTNSSKIEWHPKKYQLASFESIVKKIKAKNIHLILIQSPVTHQLYRRSIDNNMIDNYFSGKAPYYNFNNIVNLNDSLQFYDNSHLNQLGVKMFNEAVIKVIKKQ